MTDTLVTNDVITIQIPERVQDEGPTLVAFMKAYYEWLDNSIYGNDIELLELRDIDETIDEFVQYFKETYLPGMPHLSPDRVRLFVKNISDFYNTRGSEDSFKLLFRLLYGLEATVYNPGQDVLIASDGKWNKPIYIETTLNFNAADYINKTVTGSLSGSTAIVENIVRKNMNGAFFSVVYLTKARGNFIAGELLTYNGDLTNAPVVLGSLNEIDVIEGGQNNQIGDVFDVVTDIGRYGKARVTGIENGTGRVDFQLLNGGSGYTINANAIISERIYTLSNRVGDFDVMEPVYQPSSNISFISSNGDFTVGDIVEGYTTGTPGVFQGNGVIVSVTQASGEGTMKVVHSDAFTDFDFADTIVVAGNTSIALIDTVGDTTATAKVVGLDGNRVGVYSSNNVFYVGNPLIGKQSNAYGIIASQSSGSGAGFGIGSLTGEETVWVNTDLLGGNNSVGIPYMDIKLSGEGSGVGFIEDITVSAGGSGYANGAAVIFLGGGDKITEIDIIDGGSGYANGERLSFTSQYGKDAVATVTTNASGVIVDTTIGNVGSGYIDTVGVTVNTASGVDAVLQAVTYPTVNADATITTDGTGAITTVTMGSIGDGFFSYPSISVGGGTGAVLESQIDWGYGFPKMPQGDFNTIINDCLTSGSIVIGTIASLNQISPGQGYNQNPFVLVIEPFTYSAARKDLVLTLSNVVSSFTIGEMLTQDITESANEIEVDVTAGPGFEIGDFITQGATTGVVYYREPTLIRVNQIVNGPFTIGPITSTGSGTEANITDIVPISYAYVAKGIVKDYNGTNRLTIARTTFNTSFNNAFPIRGLTSGATADVTSIIQDDASLPMGGNAIVTAEVKTANGIATSVEVIDSGFGYIDDYQVTLVNEDNPFAIRGLTEVKFQGFSEGYWLNTDGFLNSDKYLHDGNYYQAFSYEVQVGISLDRYADIVKKLLHTAGTKMFGRYILVSTNTIEVQAESDIQSG